MADLSMRFYSGKMARHISIRIVFPFEMVERFGCKPPCKTLYFLPGRI